MIYTMIYIIRDGMIEKCDDPIEWSEFMQNGGNLIAHNEIDGVHISTVFLGIDYSLGMSPIPLLFETMIFGGRNNSYVRRFHTIDEAIAGHAEAMGIILNAT